MTSIFLAMFWAMAGTVAAATPDGVPQVVAVYGRIPADTGMLVPAPGRALPDRGIYRVIAPRHDVGVVELDEAASGTVDIPTP